MEQIKKWFETDVNNKYELNEYEGYIEATNDIAKFMVVAPHIGTNYKWMLRVAATASFDRWLNSTSVEEFFETENDVCKYLQTQMIKIYETLLTTLSADYEVLYTHRR